MSEGGLLPVREPFAPAAEHAASEQRRVALTALVMVVAVFALSWPSTASLVERWQDVVHRTYTHGYIVVALSCWLIWRGRAHWVSGPSRPFLPGAILILGLSVAWLVALRAGLQIVHQALLPLLIFAAVLTSLGPGVTRRMWLPLAYIYFAIPIWDALIPVLQGISVSAVHLLLLVADVPAFFDGNRFQIPAGTFVIADGCSGLHFFAVATSIAVLYGEIYRDGWRTRLATIALAAGLAMLTNWVRIFIIVMAGHLTQMQHALVRNEHYTFGWFIFAGMMIAFFLIVRRFPAGNASPDGAPSGGIDAAGQGQSRSMATGIGLAVAALCFAPLWSLIDADLAAPEQLARLAPRPSSSWNAQPVSMPWHPVFKTADHEELLQFASGNDVVQQYTASYARQRQGKELVSYDNSLVGPDLRVVSQQAAAGAWTELLTEDEQGRRWVLRYLYRIDSYQTSRALRGQLVYAFSSLVGAPASAVVITRSACSSDCQDARAALDRFSADARL